MEFNDIKEQVEKEYGIDISEKKRTLEYVEARAIYYTLCKEFLPKTFRYAKVGRLVNRDHATAMHGIKTFESLHLCDPTFRNVYEKIRESIKLPEGMSDATKILNLKKQIKDSREEVAELKKIIFDYKVYIKELKINKYHEKNNTTIVACSNG